MVYEKTKYSVAELVDAMKSTTMKPNEEYQRGATWKESQMQGLLDSLFREYPIPPLFLHERSTKSLGRDAVWYDIVDGQQRVRAMRSYFDGNWPLLKASDPKLRIPNSLRSQPAPWGGFRFTELSADLQAKLSATNIDVFVVKEVSDTDEIRDLFIRLQSGTALSRQQVRDAWPGNIGPYVVRLAGKLDSRPAVELFTLIDKRGTRTEDEQDQYDGDRQFCAQLLCLFLARESDYGAEQSIGAADLDRMYHTQTAFDTKGETAKRFEQCLALTTLVFKGATAASAVVQSRLRKKFKKLDVIAVFLFMQELTRNKQLVLSPEVCLNIGNFVNSTEVAVSAAGRSTSGPKIAEYYRQWRAQAPEVVRRDARRVFSVEEKVQMLEAQQGLCAVCCQTLTLEEADGDHFPVPYIAGGPTSLSNGRVVHRQGCHARGRSALAAN